MDVLISIVYFKQVLSARKFQTIIFNLKNFLKALNSMANIRVDVPFAL